MDTYEEISKVARELYEKSGRIAGRDEANWLEAEKIVRARHSAPAKGKTPKKTAEVKPAKKATAGPGTAKSVKKKAATPKITKKTK